MTRKKTLLKGEKRSTTSLMLTIGMVVQRGNSNRVLETALDSRKLNEIYYSLYFTNNLKLYLIILDDNFNGNSISLFKITELKLNRDQK